MKFRSRKLVPSLASLLCLAARAASAALADPPKDDIAILAEHVPEAAQDARYFTLPWPVAPLAAGEWQSGAVAGGASATGGPIELRGFLAAFGATRGLSDRWGLDLIGFVDRFSISGSRETAVLRDPFHGASGLDLAERASFDRARGTVSHEGFGVGALRELSAAGATTRWTLRFGAFVERLELSDYALDYRLLGGADAGASGAIDFSSSATFVTPFVGMQRISPLGERWQVAWRLLAGTPLPPGDFDHRLTGPGVDLSSARGDGSPGQIGDSFLALGLALVDRRSGLDLDLGSLLSFPAFETITHEGLDRSYLIQVGWHPRHRN